MKDQQLIDKDIVLAKFLDGIVDSVYSGEDKKGRFEQLVWRGETARKYRKELMGFSIGEVIMVEQLRFQESYDWIIPVWNKFKKLQTEGVAWEEYINWVVVLRRGLAYKELSEFHNMLVQAVRWYNSLNAGQGVLYHVTKEMHIDSIQKKGLIPNYRKGLYCGNGKLLDVYLTNDVDRILKTQAGENWCKRWKPVVFEVNIDGLKLLPLRYYSGGTYTISNFEFRVEGKVSAQRLKLKEVYATEEIK